MANLGLLSQATPLPANLLSQATSIIGQGNSLTPATTSIMAAPVPQAPPDPVATSAALAPARAKPIVLQEEIQRFVDLGLGRGVDSTDPTPWHNKSSFQVRHPNFNNIIGTDEGGFLESYKSSLSSSFDLQLEMKASVAIPHTPVSIGLEAGYSRSTNSSKKVVGKRVVNRTISFHMHHESSVDGEEDHNIMKPTFEEVISQWILKRIYDRGGRIEPKQLQMKGKAITLLNDYLVQAKKEEAALIVEDCTEFIRFYGVTHYVSSITLGASEHTVLTESEYSRMVSEGFNVSASQIGSAKQKLTIKSKTSKSSMNMRRLGKVVDEMVQRCTNDEAVVGVKILPMHSLISNNRFVFLAMNRALTEYSDEKAITLTGPYLIECGDEGLYWQVGPKEDDYPLTATADSRQASVFHIISAEETDDPYDFAIGWKSQTLQNVLDEDALLGENAVGIPKMFRYLQVNTYYFGHDEGPLTMKSKLGVKESRLVLYKPLTDDYFESPADITPWLEKKKVFFISSSNRRSFVSMSKCTKTEEKDGNTEVKTSYKTRCLPSQSYHDEKSNWLLFRLLPVDDFADYTRDSLKKKESVFEGSKRRLSGELTKFLGHQ